MSSMDQVYEPEVRGSQLPIAGVAHNRDTASLFLLHLSSWARFGVPFVNAWIIPTAMSFFFVHFIRAMWLTWPLWRSDSVTGWYQFLNRLAFLDEARGLVITQTLPFLFLVNLVPPKRVQTRRATLICCLVALVLLVICNAVLSTDILSTVLFSVFPAMLVKIWLVPITQRLMNPARAEIVGQTA
ncbi:MAG: hypothetical protein JSS83_05040 [Cyanobacteria bacterium SZAS LIN-3]|nr:hypothetical protein [Cyanobacteria bacterium SZAS LIN-3]